MRTGMTGVPLCSTPSGDFAVGRKIYYTRNTGVGLTLVICIAAGLIFLGNVFFAAEPLPKYQKETK